MQCVLFSPPAANPYTGGHLYNRRVVDAVGDRARLDARSATPEELNAQLHGLGRDSAVVPLLDSLYLLTLEPGQLRRAGSAIHLVHYLPDCDPRYGWAQRAAWRPRIDMVLRAAAGCVVTSDYMAGTIGDRLGRHHVRVCPPGLDPQPVSNGAVRDGPVRILTVANLEPRKGVRELLRCLATLRDLDWHWDVVGCLQTDRDYSDAVRDDLRRRGIEERTTLHGALPPDGVRGLLAQADVFALLTRYEPYGMVFAEAVGASVPVVSYRSGGVTETVDHGVTGLLARTRDDETVTQHLAALIRSAELRAQMRAACGVAAQRFPTWRQCGHRLLEAVEKLLAVRGAQA